MISSNGNCRQVWSHGNQIGWDEGGQVTFEFLKVYENFIRYQYHDISVDAANNGLYSGSLSPILCIDW